MTDSIPTATSLASTPTSTTIIVDAATNTTTTTTTPPPNTERDMAMTAAKAHIEAETVAATAAITAAIAAATAEATAKIVANVAIANAGRAADVVSLAEMNITDHALCGSHTASITALICDDQRHQSCIEQINENLSRVTASLDRVQANDEEDHRRLGILWDANNKYDGKTTNAKAISTWGATVIGWLLAIASIAYNIFHKTH